MTDAQALADLRQSVETLKGQISSLKSRVTALERALHLRDLRGREISGCVPIELRNLSNEQLDALARSSE
jgi:signal transduction histidine kinase